MIEFYSEQRIAEALELPREKMRGIRSEHLALSDPEHFTTVKREIAYTPAGMGRLLEYLKAAGFDALPASLEAFALEEQPPTPGDVVILTVRHICKNRHLLDAKKEGGEEVRVWVPDNAKFIPKMELKARPRPGAGPGLYELVGRCPRRKGRY